MKRLVLYVFALLPIATLISNAQIVGGIELDYDPATTFTVEAGTTLPFELVARDTARNIIGNWDAIGRNAVLTVRGSNAETDSSTRSWSDDPLGFSWLELRLNGTLLVLDSTGAEQQDVLLFYTIPTAAFTTGRAALAFTQSATGRDIILGVTPRVAQLEQQSPPITILPGPDDNYFVDLGWPLSGDDKVFLQRRYEIVVAPRDRYLNWISGRNVETSFSALFPAEFDTSRMGLSNIFSGRVYINGLTNYFLMSSVRRIDANGDVRQIIMANKEGDASIKGWSDPFEIIDHAPNPFALREPVDRTILVLSRASDTQTFTWVKSLPQDPYTDIQVSRFNPATYSDAVKYDITFVDAPTLTRSVVFDADSGGLAASFSTTHGQLAVIMDQLSGSPTSTQQEVVWYVTARDYDNSFGQMEGPQYATMSSPPYLDPQTRPGFRLRLVKEPTHVDFELNPEHFALRQNFPNPFSPSTSIRVEIPYPTWGRLAVYNLLGEEVAILHDGMLPAGRYPFQFKSAGLTPGVYTYTLFVNGEQFTRSMLMLR
ncbi:MAG: hypothetical protein M5R41_06260 [Bacteroidia bacterium]|nr:hypothetical protein [Bacteroidia bacterium]